MQCTAHKKNGNRCRLPPILGGNVCHKHGGSAPQVRRKAQERLNNSADRMAALLLKLATSAESEQVRLSAIKDALDRAGLTAKQAMLIEVLPWQRIIEGIVTEDPNAAPDKLFEALADEGRVIEAGDYDDEDQAAITYGPTR